MEIIYDDENRLQMNIKNQLDFNISAVEQIFADCQDVVKKEFYIERLHGNLRIYAVYIDGLADSKIVEDGVIKPLSVEWRNTLETDPCKAFFQREMQTLDIKEEKSFHEVVLAILKGDTAIFLDGSSSCFVVSTKKLPIRSIGTNDSEAGMRGPRDSFTESFRQSTALIRRRIRDPKLKVEQGTIGQRSRTDYGILYLSDVAKPELVAEVKKRLNQYEIDAIFDSGMAEHLMEEEGISMFPTFQATIRPDKVAAGIVEGRVAIVFDNSPEVILAPASLNMMLQASDDYYTRWTVGTFARILRYIACVLAIALPGFYISITVFHSEMLPTKLLYAIAAARSLVTFPIVVEVLVMEFLFELLREAGIRLPGPLGNTIGVVGGLIVGQSAVEAGIVSTMVVIVVALTAICSFAIPNEEFASVFRLLKYFVILTASVLGLYGFMLGLLMIAVHLSELKSFGVPYMQPLVSDAEKRSTERDDFILRAPILKMCYRPDFAQRKNLRRLRKRNKQDL